MFLLPWANISYTLIAATTPGCSVPSTASTYRPTTYRPSSRSCTTRKSPYAFSVVEPSVLGQVYDQFLGEKVVLDAEHHASLVVKPELRHDGGVVPTPGFLADALLDRALVNRQDYQQAGPLRVCDPASGSGVFLVGAYRRLVAIAEADGAAHAARPYPG
jgi:hypothetical protein